MGDVWREVFLYERPDALAHLSPMEKRFWLEDNFSPKPPVKTRQELIWEGHGPCSNTGQKASEVAIIDYLTLVISAASLERERVKSIDSLVDRIFGFDGEVTVGEVRKKSWNFYPYSAPLNDRDGCLVGRIGFGGNRNTYCISLSGAGCKWVKDWRSVANECFVLDARVSRVDLAHDDYEGGYLNVHAMRERAAAGDFASGGCPPNTRFLSDEGCGTGSTLYVGGKGHKELCIYEKGKQLGMKESRWVRAEVRLYGKHVAIPLDVLASPSTYFRGAYSVLNEIVEGVCTRLKTIKKQVEATGNALVTWLRRQVGPALNVLSQTFRESWPQFLEEHVVREGQPQRFKGVAKGDALYQLLRSELCPSAITC